MLYDANLNTFTLDKIISLICFYFKKDDSFHFIIFISVFWKFHFVIFISVFWAF